MISKGDIIMADKKDWSKILGSHYKILEQIFKEPPPNLSWIEILYLLKEVKKEFQKDGVEAYVDDPVPGEDAIYVQLNGAPRGVFYVTDLSKPALKEYIRRLRKILEHVGVIPSASRSRGLFSWRL
jgi:hypothetical protein